MCCWARLQRLQQLEWVERGTRSAGMDDLLMCERPVDGFSWSPPVRPQKPRRSSWWWKMCSCRARSHNCCQLERPADCRRLTGAQLRATDRAMAARSVRTSSSEDESSSTDEDERLLMKCCIEGQWETLLEREKASVRRDQKSAQAVNFQIKTREMCRPGWVKDQGSRQ